MMAVEPITLQRIANQLRRDVLQMTAEAGSGHPTTCMSCADIMAVLFWDAMRWDPTDPKAKDVDYFVLSKGHAAPILWAALSQAGAIRDDLLTLRRLTSNLEGHPTPRVPWVKVATGSLGQGLSAGCGMAIAKQLDGLPGRVYVLLGDGECAEGAVWEAVQFAAHRRLTNLCAIVDLNRLGQSGPSFFEHHVEAVRARFTGFGWHTIGVDGHHIEAVRGALNEACACADRPTVIVAKTMKGKGVTALEDQQGWHGKPLKKGEELEQALAEIGEGLREPVRVKGRRYSVVRPATWPVGRHPSSVKATGYGIRDTGYGQVQYKIGDQVATREAYGNALVRLGATDPEIVVLDADVKNSTFSEKFLKAYPERFVECFIAEQNMCGMALGLAAEGKKACASTFACFLTRAYDFLRMAVYSRPKRLLLCGSHAGVSIGEDGPSQMALEDFAMMRGLVASTVVCPCDAVSTERLVEELLATSGVSYIRTTRPKTPVIYTHDEAFPVGGAKVIRHSPNDRVALVGTGVTVHEALKAADQLAKEGIAARVIDAYSLKPIAAATLRDALETTGCLVTIEDHSPYGGLGEAVCHALAGVPRAGRIITLAVHESPRSGTPDELLDYCHISAAAIVATVRRTLQP